MEILKSKKEKVPPHVLMDRILKHEASFAKSLLPATDQVLFNYGPPARITSFKEVSLSMQTNSLTD